jgi:hypothetical protein
MPAFEGQGKEEEPAKDKTTIRYCFFYPPPVS